MAESNSTTNRRLIQIKDLLTMNKTAMEPPWDPNCTIFPTRHSLPSIPGAPKFAAWVWGPTDQLGRINLLTPTRVLAAKSYIKTGEVVPVNLPLSYPHPPSFGREHFVHKIKTLRENRAYDDTYEMNTQSGTQWDGLRHFAHQDGVFYNGVTGADITGEAKNERNGMHAWSEHGIAGRGLLLDFWHWAQKNGVQYDPFEHYEISYEQLRQCGKDQGIDVRPASQGGDVMIGDLLFVRMGWKVAYDRLSTEERVRVAERIKDPPTHTFAGLKQEEAMLDFLHDGYFAAVAGDMPSLEAWPTQCGWHLHEYILSMWGMPLGEMLDLEGLAAKCRERGRWQFFFTSSPANVKGGVGSAVNGIAIL